MCRLKLWLIFLIFLFPACSPRNLQPFQASEILIKSEQPTLYDSIVLDIVSAPGKGPSAEALAFFINSLKLYDICNKVTVNYRTDVIYVLPIWNSGLIRQFEAKNRKFKDTNPKDRRLVLFICYLPGEYLNGEVNRIAGIQYGPTSFAIFRDRTKDSYEGVVLLHEFGHIIRLARSSNRKEPPVNPDRPNHCNDENCTMYWRADNHRTTLDDKCLDDLKKLVKKANS